MHPHKNGQTSSNQRFSMDKSLAACFHSSGEPWIILYTSSIELWVNPPPPSISPFLLRQNPSDIVRWHHEAESLITCLAIISGYKGYNYNDIESMQVRSQITTPLPSSYNKFQLWTHPHTIHTHSQYTHMHTHTHVHTHNTHTHTLHTHTYMHIQYTHMHPHALQYISRNAVV